MREETNLEQEYRIGNISGLWLGWIGVLSGVIALFWQPALMGIIAMVMGLLCLFSSQKVLSGMAIAIGIVAIVVGYL